MVYFEIYKGADGFYRWRLIAANGEKIAASGEAFYSKDGAKLAAERVKRLAPIASIL